MSDGDELARPPRLPPWRDWSSLGQQQLVDLVRLHAHQGFVFADEALVVHVDGQS